MHIKKLDLLNIRSYKNASMTFSPGINLIIGPNNSGKSTILKSIQRLQPSYSAIVHTDIRKLHDSGKIHMQLVDIPPSVYSFLYSDQDENALNPTKTLSVLFGFYNLPSKKEKEESCLVDQRKWKLKIGDTDFSFTSKSQTTQSFDQFKGFPSMENENNFIYLFLSKRRSNQYSGNSGKNSENSVDDDLRNLPSKIKKLTNSSHQFYKEFTKYCSEILDFPIGSVSGASNQTEDKIGLFVKHETIYLESMGEGVANILGLLSILLTESNKVFLIEELENDIHPEALKKLLNLIIEKSQTNQFIISTHSNIVLKYLASAKNTKIFYTDWELSSSEIDSRMSIPTSTISEVENTPIKRLEILEKLGYDLFDFDLYKSYIVFEESSAEQIVRDFLIPKFVPKLHNKVKTIGARGANNIQVYFDDFLRLFVYLNGDSIYNKKAWVLADGDEAGHDSIAALKNRFPEWPEDRFRCFSKDNFEEYYPKKFKEQFIEAKKIVDKRKRFEAKGKLTGTVVDWIRKNEELAIEEFSVSAAEVIDILKKISTSI